MSFSILVKPSYLGKVLQEKINVMLVYLSKLPKEVNQAKFETILRSVCKDEGIQIKNPNWLMICMNAESDMKLVTNSIGAYGWIQFTKSTALDVLGISVDVLKTKTWEEYLDKYVRVYLRRRIKEKGIPQNAYDLYALIHYPVAFEKPDSYVLYSSPSNAYTGNKGLDKNKDGKVTVLELKKYLDGKCPIAYDKTQLLKPETIEQNFYYVNYNWQAIGITIGVIVLALGSVVYYGPKLIISNIKNLFKRNGKASSKTKRKFQV